MAVQQSTIDAENGWNIIQIIETNNDATYYDINLEFQSKTVVEDTAMMVVTELNFTRPSFRCNEGVLHERPSFDPTYL